jgi:DNA-binding MarR family transcriptional regulator
MPKKTVTTTEPDDRGPLLGALLRRAHQALLVEVLRELAEAGYPNYQPAHNAVLVPLWDRPDGMRSIDLAARARITKQSMGAVIDTLERLGFVERVGDGKDKRAKLIRLTKRGRESARVARAAVRRIEKDWARRIGADRVAALRDSLTMLLASIETDA